MKKIILIGASGHGKVAADIAHLNGYNEILFIDDNKDNITNFPYPVIGKSEDIEKYSDADFFVSIGNAKVRERIQKMVESKGFNVISLIHPSTIISENTTIGKGTLISAGAIINASAIVGEGCIINTAATIGHDCKISDFVHVSAGVHVAGTVNIGIRTWVGIGSIVSNNLNICEDCMIGAGTVVVKDIVDSGTYFGVPAKRFK